MTSAEKHNTNGATSRRQFFRRMVNKDAPRSVMTPPWAVANFFDHCSRCGDCLPVCGEGILVHGDGEYPTVSFAQGECTFCGACVEACEEGALSSPAFQDNASPWTAVAALGEACLAFKGVECRVCKEQCDYGAIRMQLAVGGVAKPELSPEDCSGCGACVAPCPVGAVTVQLSA